MPSPLPSVISLARSAIWTKPTIRIPWVSRFAAMEASHPQFTLFDLASETSTKTISVQSRRECLWTKAQNSVVLFAPCAVRVRLRFCCEQRSLSPSSPRDLLARTKRGRRVGDKLQRDRTCRTGHRGNAGGGAGGVEGCWAELRSAWTGEDARPPHKINGGGRGRPPYTS